LTDKQLPLLRHRVSEPSAFTPEALIEAVRAERSLHRTHVPAVCFLDFDGDLTDWLVANHMAQAYATWACFHTRMYSFFIDGTECGIVARTIGGPYAVLVAEQLLVSGAQVQLGITSGGRIDSSLPLPSLVVATSALRDEGTSFHYAEPAETVSANPELAAALFLGLQGLTLPVFRGCVWTTDAPYRETRGDIAENLAKGALAVEMQAASLFAFAQARHAMVGVVAHLTNAVDDGVRPDAEKRSDSDQFDKGSREKEWEIVQAMGKSAMHFLSLPGNRVR
jgi:uridine phosphorylase